MKTAIESLLRDHVRLCRDLVAEREPQVRLATIERHWRVLADRFGQHGLERIVARAQALVREIVGGAPAPALANARIDPWYVVEADILAERLAAEYRAAGDRPSADPAWRDKLNTRYATLVDRHFERLEARAAARVAPTPSPNLEDVRVFIRAWLESQMALTARWQPLVDVSEVAKLGAIAFPGPGHAPYRLAVEYIARLAAAQALELPLVPGPFEVDAILTAETATALRQYAESIAAEIVNRQTSAPAREGSVMRDRGIWQPAEVYEVGHVTTHRGTIWCCREHTTAMPGTDGSWRLMVKTQRTKEAATP
jgi:hypothetical protein